MSLRLLHMADLHLDASFAKDGLDSTYGSWRRADLRATLGRILTLARQHHVDVVTIAGDLFDQRYALPDTAAFLAQQFAQIAPIRVVIAPGQSDPYTNDSLYALMRWPANVTIFTRGRLDCVPLAPKIFLWGANHPFARDAHFSEAFQGRQPGTHLLLLHDPTIEHRNMTGNHHGLSLTDFQLALLGGNHDGRFPQQSAGTFAYPGSPDPLGWHEAGYQHGIILVSIDEGDLRGEGIETSQWRYADVGVDLGSAVSLDDAIERVTGVLQGHELHHNRSIVRVRLNGNPVVPLDMKQLAEALKPAHVLLEPQRTIPYGLERLAAERSVRGELVRRIQQRLGQAQTDQEREDLLDTLRVALHALAGEEIRRHEVS